MIPLAPNDWVDANQRYLTAALSQIKQALEFHTGSEERETVEQEGSGFLAEMAATMPAPPALDVLSGLFGLSAFERSTLLLCAGVELDAALAGVCAEAQGDASRAYVTFGLALAALDNGHWSALSPASPLRRWRLAELGGESPTRSPLRIDERILHYLAGLQYLDGRLEGLLAPVRVVEELLPSQLEMVGQLTRTWSQGMGGVLPVAQLHGGDRESRRAVAAQACGNIGLGLYEISVRDLPPEPRELSELARLWERESALSASALLLECGDNSVDEAAHEIAARRFVDSTGGATLMAGDDRLPTPRRRFFTLRMLDPELHEKRTLWLSALGEAADSANGQVDALVAQFNLGPERFGAPVPKPSGATKMVQAIWETCCGMRGAPARARE